MGKLIDEAGGDAPVFVASKGLKIRPGDAEEPRGRPALVARPDELRAGGDRARAASLGKVDPAGRADLRGGTPRATWRRCSAMDAANKRTLRAVPVAQRKLVTNHDAFGYFAAHYDITVLGSVLDSLSTSAQPSAQDIADLVDEDPRPRT